MTQTEPEDDEEVSEALLPVLLLHDPDFDFETPRTLLSG